MTEYAKQKRVVLRRLATYLDEAIVQHYEWLDEKEDSAGREDEPTRRRRLKAAHAIMKDLEKRGAEPL